MLEKIVYLQNEVLGAPPEIVVPAAIFLFVLIALMLGLRGRTQTVEHHGLEAKVRRWIGDRIAEHISILAEAYGEPRALAEHAELPPGFAATIETLIAEVLLRERDAGDLDVDLGAAVREFVVLHRAEIYDDVTARTPASTSPAPEPGLCRNTFPLTHPWPSRMSKLDTASCRRAIFSTCTVTSADRRLYFTCLEGGMMVRERCTRKVASAEAQTAPVLTTWPT